MNAQRPLVVGRAPPWLISLALHAAILAVLACIGWTVVHAPEPSIVVELAAADEPGGGLAGSGRQSVSGAASAPGPTVEAPASPRPAAPLPPLQLLDPAAIVPPAPAVAGDPMPAARSDPALALVAGLVGDSQPNGQDREGLAELLAGTSGAFQKVIGGLRRQGLDIVLVMDATNSMAPYIEQAKSRLRQIIGVTTALLSAGPMDSSRGSVRFGVVAYKDYGDEYGLSATRELPLTEDVDRVQAFIEQITAGGGGDEPEPIHEAIRAAADPAMGWKRGRRALIVLVADAPVHAMARQQAVQAAEDFARRHRGTINVIDVGGAGQQGARTSVLDDLNRIAAAAGGSAFLLRDEDRFWTHLVVSVFGHQFEQDVQTIVERYGRGSP